MRSAVILPKFAVLLKSSTPGGGGKAGAATRESRHAEVVRVRQVEDLHAHLEPLLADAAEPLEHGEIDPLEVRTSHLRGIAAHRREIRLPEGGRHRRIRERRRVEPSREAAVLPIQRLARQHRVAALPRRRRDVARNGERRTALIHRNRIDAPAADQLIDQPACAAAEALSLAERQIVAKAEAHDVRRIGVAQRPIGPEQPERAVATDVVDQPLTALVAALREGVVGAARQSPG